MKSVFKKNNFKSLIKNEPLFFFLWTDLKFFYGQVEIIKLRIAQHYAPGLSISTGFLNTKFMFSPQY